MRFVYQYRTSDNVRHQDVVDASSRDAVYALLKSRGIRPERVVEAPGLLNKLFGRGKRWMLIAVLFVLATVSFFYNRSNSNPFPEFDDGTRRQVIGDNAVIEEGIRTGWANVFDQEGDRFLASFAVPGVRAGLRSTSEASLRAALSSVVSVVPEDGLEARQIKAMVAGMKREANEFVADGGTLKEFGDALVARQEREQTIYAQAKSQVDNDLENKGLSAALLTWRTLNDQLRRLGIRPLPMPEGE